MPTFISLVRHGLVHNPQRILYGRRPRFRLSQEGRQQAQAAAGYLADRPLVALYSSPMLRARQTARIILASRPELPLRISGYLHEVYVVYEGHPISELEARQWDLYSDNPPPYEQPPDILQRVQQFVARARRRYPGQHVAAVTHGDPVLFMIRWASQTSSSGRNLLDLDLPDPYPAPASVTTFTYQTDEADEIPAMAYVRPY